MDTIFALSSGRPPAAIAIVRISGVSAFTAAERISGVLPAPRTASLRALRAPTGALLDSALLIVFPGPATATGEDLVELHCHGGRAVVDAVCKTLATIEGLRPAVAGEFTRRALTNGRIDLTEAEGLADLLEAETEAQRVAALGAAEGRISRLVQRWMNDAALVSARIEAILDFSDEDDVANDDAALQLIAEDMAALADRIALVVDAPPVERLRDGLRVVIGGPPNSGKSTLLNLLSERDAAIVSPISGTTRDRIELPVVRDGVAYRLTDTAGLTATIDPIEAIGVTRAEQAIIQADIILWLADTPPPRDDALWLHARADLPGREELPRGRLMAIAESDPATISRLWSVLADRAGNLLPQPDVPSVNAAQRAHCQAAVFALRDGLGSHDPLIMAETLRRANAALASILGIDATGAMLDALFGRFCIGK